jgi:glycerol-3-phosphate acyltransferase PlsX
VIAHGRSSAKAIKNAIRQAKLMVDGRVIDNIRRDIEESIAGNRPAAQGEST